MATNRAGNKSASSAPYQKVYTNPAATVDLSASHAQAKKLPTGFYVQATAATTVNWKDAAGNACAVALDDNAFVHFEFAISTLEASATCIIVVYWHP